MHRATLADVLCSQLDGQWSTEDQRSSRVQCYTGTYTFVPQCILFPYGKRMQKATKGWGLVNTSFHLIGAYYISDDIMLHFSANEQDLRSTWTPGVST
jgi:hypothetical protein